MRTLGERWDADPRGARKAARSSIGATIARELRAHGVDFSFTPVLDLDYAASAVIGDRAFHADPVDRRRPRRRAAARTRTPAACAGVGKHFPGHGFVAADSHVDTPVDDAPLDDDPARGRRAVRGADAAGPRRRSCPRTSSIRRSTRARPGSRASGSARSCAGACGFDGLVFSDDLEMAGAQSAGDIVARADAAIAAGCDVGAGLQRLRARWTSCSRAGRRRAAALARPWTDAGR